MRPVYTRCRRRASPVSLAAGSACALLLACSAAARAEEPAEQPAVVTSPVVVTATRVEQNSFDVPASIDAVDSFQLQEGRARVNVSEALNRVPGIVLQNRQQYAQDIQLISRGFGARSQFGVRGVRIIVDDIPASMPDGQGTTGLFTLSSAGRVEVLRGPFSALYGNHSGGVVRFFTEDGPARPTVSASFDAGSFDTLRAGAKFSGTAGEVNWVADAFHFETGGYRQHGGAVRDQANAKLRWNLDNGSRLTLVANTLDQPGNQDPQGLTRQDLERDPRQASPSAIDFNTRRSLENQQAGLVYELPLTAQDTITAVGYLGTRSNEQYLSTPLIAQRRVTSGGGVSAYDRDFGGINLRWTRRAELAGGPLTLTAGADWERMQDHRVGFENFEFNGSFFNRSLQGVKGRQRRDEDNGIIGSGEYLQAEWQFLPRWRALAGVRHSKVRFSSDDHYICTTGVDCPLGTNDPAGIGGNLDDSGHVDYEQTVPVAGLLFQLTPAVNLYANYGEGFETPTNIEVAYRPLGQSGLNFNLRPMQSTSWEMGMKAFVGEAARVNLAGFWVDTEDEIVVFDSIGGRVTYQNAGRTARRGIEAAVEAAITRKLSVYLAYTWLEAYYRDSFQSCVGTCIGAPNTSVPAGNRIPAIPQSTFYGELLWRDAGTGFYAALETYWQSKVFVDDLNSDFGDAYGLFNLRAGLEQRAGSWRFKEFVRVDNLADEDYVAAVIVNDANGRFFSPGPERSWLAGVMVEHSF